MLSRYQNCKSRYDAGVRVGAADHDQTILFRYHSTKNSLSHTSSHICSVIKDNWLVFSLDAGLKV